MIKYVLKRLLIMIPVVVCVAILIFTIMTFTPGDPAALILGPTATPEEVAELRATLGLDDSYLVRLGRFLSDTFLHFDFGDSIITKTPVLEEIAERFPRTLLLAVLSVVISAVLGVTIGVTSAVHQNGPLDRITMFLAMLFTCVPDFWLGLILVVILAVKFNLLPAYGIGGFEYYIIPGIALVCSSFGQIARQTRSSMLEVIRSDYVTTAYASGFPKRMVNYRYALPNALIPVVTMIGMRFAGALGGTIIIETIFSIPGLGLYMSNAISSRDFPVIQGTVVFLSILFCIIMLLIDLMYAMIDPRIKAQYSAGRRKKKK